MYDILLNIHTKHFSKTTSSSVTSLAHMISWLGILNKNEALVQRVVWKENMQCCIQFLIPKIRKCFLLQIKVRVPKFIIGPYNQLQKKVQLICAMERGSWSQAADTPLGYVSNLQTCGSLCFLPPPTGLIQPIFSSFTIW